MSAVIFLICVYVIMDFQGGPSCDAPLCFRPHQMKKKTADPSEPAVGRRAWAPQGRCMSDEVESDSLLSLNLGFIQT